tara:strand:- start:5241 stop:5675 length:435 start_codon:yes stop_codon:yes gene_type:complete
MLIFVVSCNNDDDNNPEFQPTEIAFTEVGRGSLLGNGDEGISESILLINTDTDWQNLMTQMNINGNTTAGFSETDIDFETYSIIAVFLDVKLTSWYLEITNIIENETNITVTIDEYQPIIFLNSITQPFHIVKIPKTDKPIVLD